MTRKLMTIFAIAGILLWSCTEDARISGRFSLDGEYNFNWSYRMIVYNNPNKS